jgi:hypothetical protein
MNANENTKTTELTKEQIEQWKAQYGEVYKIQTDTDNPNEKPLVFYFQKPARTHFSRFIKDSMKDAYKAMHTMINDLALHPSKEKLAQIFQEKPGLVVAVGNELNKIIGVSEDFLTSKV